MSAVDSRLVDASASFIEDRYQEDLALLVDRDDTRLSISWEDLWAYDPDLAEDLLDHPAAIFPALKRGLKQAELDPKVEGVFDANRDRDDVEFVVTDLAERKQSVSSLRWEDVGRYVALDAQVETRTQVEPFIEQAVVVCSCGHPTRAPQVGEEVKLPNKCGNCDKKGPFEIDHRQSEWADQQIIEIADPPEESVGRRDSIVVEAYNELAGKVEAGDSVVVNGVLETKSAADETSPSRRRPLRMKAKAIETTVSGYDDITPERVSEIKALAASSDLYEKLTDSIAPHILTEDRGDAIKLAIALQLFGGVERNLQSGFKRGNINILTIGDPGTAKSQLLEAANRIAPKSVKVSGKNARPAGMTATAVRSEQTGEWTLKAGALVKASGGLACIDEFDKMHGETMSSLHEALEDQSISVAKADINTTVPAKASVLAAANPKNGYFDRFQPVAEQIDVGPAIISRFDLIFGMQEIVDEDRDRKTADHQHATGDPGHEEEPPAIEHDLLTEYIAYARQNVHPEYEGTDAKDRLVDFYVEKRQEAVESNDSNIQPIGPRVNETLRRLAQASARARLSPVITMEDAERAIGHYNRTIGEVGLTEDGVIDGGKLDGGRSSLSQQEVRDTLYGIVSEMEDDYEDGVPRDVVVEVATNRNVSESRAGHGLTKMLRSEQGGIYEPANNRLGTT